MKKKIQTSTKKETMVNHFHHPFVIEFSKSDHQESKVITQCNFQEKRFVHGFQQWQKTGFENKPSLTPCKSMHAKLETLRA